MQIKDRATNRSEENGNAILEMAICLPFMLIILMASVDLGRALNQYLTITRIVYEATRYGASIGQLEPGTYPDGSGTVAGTHQTIRDRVELLLERNGIPFERVEKLRTTLANNSGQMEVKVEVDLEFDTLFYQLGFMDVLGSAEATGPYLQLVSGAAP